MAAIVATETFGAKENWQTDFVEYITIQEERDLFLHFRLSTGPTSASI